MDHHHHHLPKFKSIQPPSLPLSPPPISPSSYLALSELLDSPVLFSNSNLVASPTTGAFSGEGLFNNWSNYGGRGGGGGGINNYSDFTFQLPRALAEQPSNIRSSSVSQSSSSYVPLEEPWKRQEEASNKNYSFNNNNDSYQNNPKKTEVKSEFDQSNQQRFNASESLQEGGYSYGSGGVISREQKKPPSSSDGYKWRKYGQKQVKGSENPRSYYKCTYPNCPTKKKVETSLEDGHVTEIVYKGSHNHPKPNSSTNNNNNNAQRHTAATSEVSTSDQSAKMDSETFHEDSTSVSTGGDQDFEGMSGHRRFRGNDNDDEIETGASDPPKRWKGGDGEYNRGGSENKTVREPRVVVQTLSEIDILDDGYRWRKYGQKVVKGNPNPRSYYKCTYIGCPVRKHVERAAQDMRAVITTYEGKHNHDIPVGRGAGANAAAQTMLLHNNNAAAPPPIIRPTAIPRTTTTAADNQGLMFGYNRSEEMMFQQQTNSSFGLDRTTKEEPTDNSSFFASFLS